jgi:hypothetical protein
MCPPRSSITVLNRSNIVSISSFDHVSNKTRVDGSARVLGTV